MTTPLPVDAGPGTLGALIRAGLRTGQPVELELVDGTRVAGNLVEAALDYQARTVDTLVVGTSAGTLSVIPWHAVSRVLLRAAHPAL